MPLDAHARDLLDIVARAARPEYWQLDPAAARAWHEETAPVLDARPVPLHEVRDDAFPGPLGPVPVRLYTPAPRAGGWPTLLWFHGGGHVVGSIECYDALCRLLAAQASCRVISVGYRLAPEHRFPAAVEDCLAALRWVQDDATDLGVDPARIAVGGDSAGGNLAAVVAILARDLGLAPPAWQLLVYPATAAQPDSPSHRAYGEGHLLTRQSILWFQGHYLGDEARRVDPRFAPLETPDLAALPPALVVVAECDPLHDEGVAYAERLAAAGVRVELARYAGMVHGFFSLSGFLPAGRAAVDHAARALAAALR